VVDILLLVTTFPLYCINPVLEFSGLDHAVYQQYCEAFIFVVVVPLAFVAHSATVWSTMLIGINRYVAVCHPYQVNADISGGTIIFMGDSGPRLLNRVMLLPRETTARHFS